MSASGKPSVLFVDDEPRVLEGLAKLLRREFDIHVAIAAAEALQKAAAIDDLAVIVSDMRMPGMDGATLLHEFKIRRPDVTRILLTGEPGWEAAARAVNQGQVFRFLTKPCSTEDLLEAIGAGVVHHRLAHSEREVLQETLIGCIGALMEVLAMANPVAFGRAERIKKTAVRCAARFNCTMYWQLEAAALLSQLGYVTVPEPLLEKVYSAATLDESEKAKLAAVPDVANALLEHIPRLEPVIQILAALKWPDAAVVRLGDGTIGLGTRILGATIEFEAHAASGRSRSDILALMQPRAVRFGEKVIAYIGEVADETATWPALVASWREMPLCEVTPGMILKNEIRTATGALLVPRDFAVTKTLLSRLANVAPDLLEKPVQVYPAPKPI